MTQKYYLKKKKDIFTYLFIYFFFGFGKCFRGGEVQESHEFGMLSGHLGCVWKHEFGF